jgi:NHL repeat
MVGVCSYVDGNLSSSTFNYPLGVAYNPVKGNIIVTDSGNNAVRAISGKTEEDGGDGKNIVKGNVLLLNQRERERVERESRERER